MQPLKILIAEDEIYSAMAIQQLLEVQGYETELAYDGNQALSLYQQGNFQVGLFDADMPGIDGYELALRIRQIERDQQKPPIAIVHFSGYKLPAAEMKEKGFDAQLLKPISDPAQLYQLIEQIAHIHQG